MEDAPVVEGEPVAQPRAARGRPKKAAVVTEVAMRAPAAARGRKAAPKPQEVEEEVTEIPETQQPENYGTSFDDALPEEEPPTRQISDPLERRLPSSPEKRLGYSSSSDSGSDAALRRRLGEMTQKYESLELKYRDLRELAVKEADNNFDRLKRQTDEKSKGM
jgi:hypothetical protein